MAARPKNAQRSPSNAEVLGLATQLSPVYADWLPATLSHVERGLHTPALIAHLGRAVAWLEMYETKRAYERFKRLVSFPAALLGLVLLFPLLVAVAMAVRLESRGPIFFRQLRAGRYGVPFWIFKFRTMPDTPSHHFVARDPLAKPTRGRTTRVGRILRNYKLDELPQLLNVLRGEMALVGPRPLSLSDSVCVPEAFMARFAVRPGMTGLWQATVPHDSPAELKWELDARYVTVRSLRLDIALIVRTFAVVWQGERASKWAPPPG